MTYRTFLLAAAAGSPLALGAVSALAAEASPSLAETPLEQVVVTASRSGEGQRTDLIGSSVTVIDEGALQDRGVRFIADALRDVPSVAVNRSGGVGGQVQVRIRGAEANHTLVLIDGMKASDPSQSEFDFATLIADDVARVEVLRGPQSALYGSEAIGGVVNYITATGAQAPGVRGRVEGGSFGSGEVSGRAAGVAGPLDMAVSAEAFATDGTKGSRFGARTLNARNDALSAKATYAIAPNLRIKAVSRYAYTYGQTENVDYASAPTSPSFGLPVDGQAYYDNFARFNLLSGEYEALGGRWTHALTVQSVDDDRRSYDSPGQVAFAGKTDGERIRSSYVTALKLGEGNFAGLLTVAADREHAHYRNSPIDPKAPTTLNTPHDIVNTGLVGQYDLTWKDRAAIGLALRHDDNSHFADADTYRVQGSYRLDGGVRLHAAAGSGITNPTMTELYGFDPSSFVGNPALKPERSQGWEAGADWTVPGDRAKLGLTYFDDRLEDEIFTSFTPSFQSSVANRASRSTRKGLELTGEARLGAHWRIDGSYSRLDAKENGVREIRRPNDLASVNVTWASDGDRFGATLTARYNGAMTDSYFGATTVTETLAAYTLVNLNGYWNVREGVQLYARLENAGEARYEEVFGYPSAGRAAYFGLKVGF